VKRGKVSREEHARVPEREVVRTVIDFAPLWDEFFPAEQARIVRLSSGSISRLAAP
jgi:hypothetical protein